MYRIFFLMIIIYGFSSSLIAQYELTSPDGKIKAAINFENELNFSAALNEAIIIKNASADLSFNGLSLLENAKLKKTEKESVSEEVKPIISLKESTILNNYNQLRLVFNNDLAVEFRAFNDGIAYRFVTDIDKEVDVNEKASIEFSGNDKMWASPVDEYVCSYEVAYEKVNINDFRDTMNTYLPILLEDQTGCKILITDADVFDYPHMFFKKGRENTLEATFPPYPLETTLIGDRRSKVTNGADYIAKTNGNRSFPWRVMIIAETDAQLVASNRVYLLSRENELENTEWIKPGRVAWDWWNANNLYGVDFESGLNTATYKYYIDFASEYGLEYIILDEGWSVSTTDISQPNPALDLFELIRYGKEKNVGIILWASWRAIESQFFVMETYKNWGVKGIKVDFMDRADQWMVNYYEKVAREAARNQLLVDFHGAFKPAGLHKAYPNVLAHEGVRGLENSKWSASITPEHDLTLPFIRMVSGPMDYTPGAMRNFQSAEFKPVFNRPGSQGTRCHQVAMFIIYESGIQMLADSPSNYEREPETTEFIAGIPNTWDELKVLEAKVGEYLVVARRKGDSWYIGAMNNDSARTIKISLSFLSVGEKKALIMQDGINANMFAEDYKRLETTVTNGSQLTIKMAKGGGFAAIIK
jgi:alpha-glucosidase